MENCDKTRSERFLLSCDQHGDHQSFLTLSPTGRLRGLVRFPSSECLCHEINSRKYSGCCMSATLIPDSLQRRLTRSSSCYSCYFRSSGSTTTHPKTLLSMKPWLDSVVVLVPNSMHQKKPSQMGYQGVQCG